MCFRERRDSIRLLMEEGETLMQYEDPTLSGLGLTAVLVTGARAAESARADRLFDDPFARAFVEAASSASPAIAQALAQGSVDAAVGQARRDSIAVRTRFFDDYLHSAVRSGCGQVVLLAAGLDTRAFRLSWPDGVRLWELDMPEMFAFKERVLLDRGAKPACQRTVVSVDLRENWSSALQGAGFDPGAHTGWLIEGLLMYLEESERDRLMDRVGALSRRGSRLALDHRPGFFSTPTVTSPDDPVGAGSATRFAALAAAASLDASLIEPAEWLGRHGWRGDVAEPATIFARYGRTVPAQLQPAVSGAPRGWIATAERN
jgi:methyltransferase (TIGR00027 family)